MFSVFFTPLYADDDWLSDDFSIEIVEKNETPSIGYFEEHFSGYSFSTYSAGEQVKRFIFETRLRFKEKIFSNTSISAEYRYQSSNFDTPVQNNTTYQIYNKQFSYDLTEFRELYIDQRINQFLSFKGGKQTIIWGQWTSFSPIDLLLPFDFAIIGPSFNKEQIKQPIESYNLSFTPINEWITTFYYFPKFTLDFSSRESLDYAEENGEIIDYPSASDQNQFALRSVYLGKNYNIGLTLFNGFEVLRNKYSSITSYDPNTVSLTSSGRYLFPKKYAIVIEANKQLSESETLGTEILIQNRKATLSTLGGSSTNGSATEKNYFDWIQNSNNGLFYSNQYMLLSSIGYEKNINRHVFKVSASYIHLINPDHLQEGYDLFDKVDFKNSSSDWTDTYRILGSLTYMYFLNEDQSQSIGTILGFLGSGIGGSFFYGLTLYETLTFGVGLEYIKYLTDMSYGTSNTGESIQNVDELALRSGLQYYF